MEWILNAGGRSHHLPVEFKWLRPSGLPGARAAAGARVLVWVLTSCRGMGSCCLMLDVTGGCRDVKRIEYAQIRDSFNPV